MWTPGKVSRDWSGRVVVGLGKGYVCQTYLPLKDVQVSCHIICPSLKTLDL